MKSHARGIAIAISGAFALVCLVWTFVTVTRDEYLTSVVVLGFAISCSGLVILYVLNRSGKIAPCVEFDAEGTTIRPDRIINLCLWIMLAAGVTGAALFAIFWPRGAIDIPVPHSQRYAIPGGCAGMAVGGVITMVRLASGKERKYLRLTPNGFEFVHGPKSAHGQWSQISDITDQDPNTPSISTPKSITVLTSDGEASTMPVASNFAANEGEAVRELMRFYWQHPDCRSQLTDGGALQRLQTEIFGRKQ